MLRNFKILLLTLIFSCSAFGADIKFSQLPLSTASGVGSNDSFPYVNATAGATQRLKLSDLSNLPALTSTFAPLVSPSFTGPATITGTLHATGATTLDSTLSVTGQASFGNIAAPQLKLSGWAESGSNSANGELQLGGASAASGLARAYYDASSTGYLILETTEDSAAHGVRIRTRTSGTPVTALDLTGSGALTLGAYGTGLLHSGSSGAVTSSLLVNADVSASAAIAYSKLNLASSIQNSDLTGQVGLSHGGTNADLSATGGTSQVLKQTSVGGAISVARLACADLSNASASCSTDSTNASNITTGTLGATVQGNITSLGTVTSGVWNAGAVTSSGNIASTQTLAGSNASIVVTNQSNNSASTAQLRAVNDASRSLRAQYASSTFSGAVITNGITGETASIFTDGAFGMNIGTNSSAALTISSAQLVTVLNTMSVTADLTLGGANASLSGVALVNGDANSSDKSVAGSAYSFTVTAANATAGATYTNNGQTFTVVSTIAGGTTLLGSATGAPAGSGVLTKTSGTGDATISFSAAATTTTNGGSGTIALGSGNDGLFLITDRSGGHSALVLMSSSSITLIADPTNVYSTSSNAASKICLTVSGGTLTIQNNQTNSSKLFRSFVVKMI